MPSLSPPPTAYRSAPPAFGLKAPRSLTPPPLLQVPPPSTHILTTSPPPLQPPLRPRECTPTQVWPQPTLTGGSTFETSHRQVFYTPHSEAPHRTKSTPPSGSRFQFSITQEQGIQPPLAHIQQTLYRQQGQLWQQQPQQVSPLLTPSFSLLGSPAVPQQQHLKSWSPGRTVVSPHTTRQDRWRGSPSPVQTPSASAAFAEEIALAERISKVLKMCKSKLVESTPNGQDLEDQQKLVASSLRGAHHEVRSMKRELGDLKSGLVVVRNALAAMRSKARMGRAGSCERNSTRIKAKAVLAAKEAKEALRELEASVDSYEGMSSDARVPVDGIDYFTPPRRPHASDETSDIRALGSEVRRVLFSPSLSAGCEDEADISVDTPIHYLGHSALGTGTTDLSRSQGAPVMVGETTKTTSERQVGRGRLAKTSDLAQRDAVEIEELEEIEVSLAQSRLRISTLEASKFDQELEASLEKSRLLIAKLQASQRNQAALAEAKPHPETVNAASSMETLAATTATRAPASEGPPRLLREQNDDVSKRFMTNSTAVVGVVEEAFPEARLVVETGQSGRVQAIHSRVAPNSTSGRGRSGMKEAVMQGPDCLASSADVSGYMEAMVQCLESQVCVLEELASDQRGVDSRSSVEQATAPGIHSMADNQSHVTALPAFDIFGARAPMTPTMELAASLPIENVLEQARRGSSQRQALLLGAAAALAADASNQTAGHPAGEVVLERASVRQPSTPSSSHTRSPSSSDQVLYGHDLTTVQSRQVSISTLNSENPFDMEPSSSTFSPSSYQVFNQREDPLSEFWKKASLVGTINAPEMPPRQKQMCEKHPERVEQVAHLPSEDAPSREHKQQQQLMLRFHAAQSRGDKLAFDALQKDSFGSCQGVEPALVIAAKAALVAQTSPQPLSHELEGKHHHWRPLRSCEFTGNGDDPIGTEEKLAFWAKVAAGSADVATATGSGKAARSDADSSIKSQQRYSIGDQASTSFEDPPSQEGPRPRHFYTSPVVVSSSPRTV